MTMADLSTGYLGLRLSNPIVASASPLCEKLDNIRRMEDAGAAAVVLHSLFEEQIDLESEALDFTYSQGADSFPEAVSYFPELQKPGSGPDEYLEHIRKAKAAVSIPIIASLNGVSTGGWIQYAKQMEEAGADAIELNVYFIPTDLDMAGPEVEQRYVELVHDVTKCVSIPIAVKLPPFFSAPANMARKLQDAGARGLVIFNRFYQPDIDLETLDVVPNLTLSSSAELRLRLRWAAILFGRINADMAVTGGVHTASDVLKCMMAGARVAMLTSALLQRGIPWLKVVLDDLVQWIEEKEYDSIKQMQGSMSQQNVANPSAFERANYLKVLKSYPVAH